MNQQKQTKAIPNKTSEPTGDYVMPVTLKRKGALPPPPQIALCEALNSRQVKVEWLAGDGSDRCYYRIQPQEAKKPFVLMQLSGRDAAALEEGGYEWIEMAKILENQGVITPKVIKALPKYAALIIEDYGDLMLEGLFQTSSGFTSEVEKSYQAALDIAVKLLSIKKNPKEVWCHRSFDQKRLDWELNFFKEKYLIPIAAISLSPQENQTFKKESLLLSEYLSNYSNYFIHRDYHSRNLMVKGDHLALIDFQDARLGPPAYDIVSIIFDSYVNLSPEERNRLLDYAVAKVETEVDKHTADIIRETWKATLLQRQLKAIGSFGFLTLEKNRGDYLKYVAPALRILLESKVQDSRWLFLSEHIISRISQSLGCGLCE